MKKTVYLGLVGAALAVGACGRLESASQERAEIRASGSETAQAAGYTGQSALGAVRNVGSGIVHGARGVGNAVVYGAREVGQELTGRDGDPAAEASSERARQRMQGQFDRSGERFVGAGRDTGRTVVGTGRTVVGAGETAWQGVEHGAGAVRRATGEQPGTVRGGGPQQPVQCEVDQYGQKYCR